MTRKSYDNVTMRPDEEEKLKKEEFRLGIRKKKSVLTCAWSSAPIQCKSYPALCSQCNCYKEVTFLVKVNYVKPNIHVQLGLF